MLESAKRWSNLPLLLMRWSNQLLMAVITNSAAADVQYKPEAAISSETNTVKEE